MAYHLDDTIVAIASAPGGSARGIVRVSGPATVAIVESCFAPNDELNLRDVTSPQAVAGRFQAMASKKDGTIRLPTDVYLWPGQRSYTRQPIAELHTIGSPPLLAAMLEAICAGGARLAEPGEFTLRAFLSGRLDLTEAEAVLAVIDSNGARQLATALDQLAGGLARPLSSLREDLLNLLAELEAGLDFVEEDIQFITTAELNSRLRHALDQVNSISSQMDSRVRAVDRPRVALVGYPNVGKSSLFNAVAGGAALVSAVPGTTRDYVCAPLEIDGLACELIDTAGVQAESVDIEASAQDMTARQMAEADLCIWCLDATREPNAWELERIASYQPSSQLIVWTKCDQRSSNTKLVDAVSTSAVKKLGIDDFRAAVRDRLAKIEPADSGGVVAGTAARCRDSLRAASEALAEAIGLNSAGGGEELVAAELRLALDELGRVVGAVYTDDILDRIFSRFCIGK